MDALKDFGCSKLSTSDNKFNDKVDKLKKFFMKYDIDVQTRSGRKEIGNITNMALHQGRCTDINEDFTFSKIFTIIKLVLIGLFGVTLSGTYFHKFNQEKMYKKILIVSVLIILSLFSVLTTMRSLQSHNYNFMTNERFFVVLLIIIPFVISAIYFLYLGNKRSEKGLKLMTSIRDGTEKTLIFLVALSLCFKVDLSGQMIRHTFYGTSTGFYESLNYDDIIFVSVLCYYIMYNILQDTKSTSKYSFEILLVIAVFFTVRPELQRFMNKGK